MESLREQALERLVDLTRAGASRAAVAFAQLASAEITSLAPVLRDGSSIDAAIDAGSTGVFFEFEGCIDALVGILFPAAASERLVRTIVGIESGVLAEEIVESALMEVGNILASHVASGIADRLHARLLPSIPALAQGRAEAEFEAWVERVVGPAATRIEVELVRATGEVAGRLVVVPTAATGEDGPSAER